MSIPRVVPCCPTGASPRTPSPAASALLADLAALLPFALALAGDEKERVAEGIARAIQEVCQWCP